MTDLIGRLSDERKRIYIEVLGFAVFFVTVLIVAGYISRGLLGHGHRIEALPVFGAQLIIAAMILPAVHFLQARRGEGFSDLGMELPSSTWRPVTGC